MTASMTMNFEHFVPAATLFPAAIAAFRYYVSFPSASHWAVVPDIEKSCPSLNHGK